MIFFIFLGCAPTINVNKNVKETKKKKETKMQPKRKLNALLKQN